MDNNTAERTLRNPVVGRKNYYGSGSVWSAHLAARMFRRFLKKNFLIQGVGTGLIKMSYLGNTGWRSKRASTACIAALPSAMPFW